MKQNDGTLTLLELPTPALQRIIRYVLGSSTGVLSPSSTFTVGTLCRTSQRLRILTASSINAIIFPSEGFWPSGSILSPHAWPELKTLDVTVNRAGLMGFLKWCVTARVNTLRTRIVGDAYADERLVGLERKLLGRFFTQIGAELVVLDVDGFDCQSLLFAALFQCTKLRTLCIGVSAAVGATVLNMFVLLCLANPQLEMVRFPFEMVEEVADGKHLHAACKVTWETLFGNYRAGLKEAAVNLPSDENELVQSFKKMDLRMQKLGQDMEGRLMELAAVGNTLGGEDMHRKLLFGVLPQLKQVNGIEAEQ